MESLDFLNRRAFSKTKLDYLMNYLYHFTDLPIFEIVCIVSSSSSFTDFDNFEFVFEVTYIDDFMEQNFVRVFLFPDFSDCFYK